MTAASLKLFTHSKELLPLVGAMMTDLGVFVGKLEDLLLLPLAGVPVVPSRKTKRIWLTCANARPRHRGQPEWRRAPVPG